MWGVSSYLQQLTELLRWASALRCSSSTTVHPELQLEQAASDVALAQSEEAADIVQLGPRVLGQTHQLKVAADVHLGKHCLHSWDFLARVGVWSAATTQNRVEGATHHRRSFENDFLQAAVKSLSEWGIWGRHLLRVTACLKVFYSKLHSARIYHLWSELLVSSWLTWRS